MNLTTEERQRINPDLWHAVFAAYVAKWQLGLPTAETEVEFNEMLERAEELADFIVWRMAARAPRQP